MFGGFGDDPFFSNIRGDFFDPFDMFSGRKKKAIKDDRNNKISRRNFFDDFAYMMEQPGESSNCYTSQSVYSYTSTGDGSAPQVYQMSKSERRGPGGLRESRKAVKDSKSGLEKMAIGHFIGDRGQVVERSRTGESRSIVEHNEYYGMRENESRAFDDEWVSRTSPYVRGREHYKRLK